MCFGKVGFEVGPSFRSFCFPTPFAAAIREHASAEDYRINIGYDLGCSVCAAAGVGVVHGIFYL